MTTASQTHRKFRRLTIILSPCLFTALLIWLAPVRVDSQDAPAAKPANTNAAAPAARPAGAPGQAESPAPPGGDASPRPDSEAGSSSDGIQLSFQGANIDMVVQWLAQTTGKSVVKHPMVQCQLTIVSSKKIAKREAINLVYHALGLEGFTAIESSRSIMIVPEGKEPKLSPELIDGTRSQIPEGRQRLVKIFPLQHIPAEELKAKIRGVLSEKATVEVDDRANRMIVTDYTENLMLLSDLIKELDISSADTSIEIFDLKYAEAEELGNLITLVLTAQSAGASSPGRSSPSPSPGPGPPPPGGPGPMPPGGGGSPSPAGGGGQSSSSSQQVRIWPDKTSNRLIVSASKSKLAEVHNLIEVLDTQKPQDLTIRVIPLKNVSAEDVAKELAPLYQKTAGKSLKDMIEVTADSRSSSLIVLSSEANFQAIKKLMATLDTEEAQEKIVKTFPLKNAEAEDVAKQLQDLYKDESASRYPYYFFSSSQPSRSTKKMSVVADRRRNTLIVQAPPAQMDYIGKMISELDEPVGDDSLAPKIYALKYISAVDIEDVLNELFLKKKQQRPYWYYFDDYPQETTERDVGRLYGKVRITSEPNSNSLIITANSKESLEAVENVIQQLDRPSEAGESTLRVGLKFAKASTVANSINILFAKGGSPPLRPVAQPGQQPVPQLQQQQSSSSRSGFDLEQEAKEEGYYPWLGGQPDSLRTSDGRTAGRPVSDLVGRVRAVADQRSNGLLISASLHYFPQILKLIEELDAATDQVLIEARLVEVSSDFLDKLGVRWSPDGSKVFTADDYDNSILAHFNGEYRKGFGGTTTVNNPANSGALSQVLGSLRSGVLSSTINMDYLVQFLRKTTEASVLAEPQINIRDNETGRLFVGQQVPIPDNTQVSQLGGQNTSIRYKDVGVVLEVTPHINTFGDVELKIHAESSTVVPGQTVLGGALFDTRNFRTDLRAKNGETLVLGGIIQRQVSDTLRKTPILGSIPVLGWAFKKKDKSTHEVELLVFLRPKVVRSAEDAKELMEEMERKAPLIQKRKADGQSDKGNEKAKEEK